MKKIVLLLMMATGVLLAKPCMTDIYFGNGVWNTRDQAKESRDALRRFMHTNYNAKLDRDKEGIDYYFKFIYNPSRGTIEDLLETFWQLKESGQIDEGYFMAKWELLTSDRGPDEFRKAMDRIATTNDIDTNKMYHQYESSSFNQKHNVLLVAHSQGNLFGNEIYTLMNDEEKKKFRMVSVGTPADHVMKNGQTSSYITVEHDYVINRIQGALPSNAAGFGHTFIGTYIGSSFESCTKIATYVKTAYDDLKDTTKCITCDYIRTKVSEINKMTVECQLSGSYVNEDIGVFYAEKFDATFDENGNATCGVPFEIAGMGHLISTNTEGHYKWETGSFTSKDELHSRKDVEETFLYTRWDQCITLTLSGEYYELIDDMLSR